MVCSPTRLRPAARRALLPDKLRGRRRRDSGENDSGRYIPAMSTIAAPPSAGGEPHRVAIVVVESVVPFDLAVPCQVFARGREDLGAVRYRAAVCAAAPGPVRTSAGFAIEVPHGLEALEGADTVVVAGMADLGLPIPPEVCAALRAAAARGARIASVCTGAFVLAEAGLLDGRRAATHWEDAPLLAARYPAVRVDAEVLYVDEGRVLTSAGIAAGIDLCLHLVRQDYGAEVANAVARRLVVPPHRSGGQAQFAERPLPALAGGGLEPTRRWMLERLAEPLTLAAMAAHAGMSRRTFSRRFHAETGASPLRWLIHQRVLLAQRLLERTSEPLERLAGRCGFGSALVLRQHFRAVVGTTPSAYRLAFRGQRPGAAGSSSTTTMVMTKVPRASRR
jgi:AraC family transcriptional regulator, transcriptional activator FtrA